MDHTEDVGSMMPGKLHSGKKETTKKRTSTTNSTQIDSPVHKSLQTAGRIPSETEKMPKSPSDQARSRKALQSRAARPSSAVTDAPLSSNKPGNTVVNPGACSPSKKASEGQQRTRVTKSGHRLPVATPEEIAAVRLPIGTHHCHNLACFSGLTS